MGEYLSSNVCVRFWVALAQEWTPGELLGSVRAAICQQQRKMTAGELREERERRRRSFLAARQKELEGQHACIPFVVDKNANL